MALTAISQGAPPRRRIRWLDVKEQLTGFLFTFPSLLIIFLFGIFPIGYVFYMSLYNWRVRQGHFVGAANYQKALGDWSSVVIFVIGFAMLFLACLLWNSALRSHHSLELGLANILIQKFKGQDFLRMLNFLPDIMQAARVGFFRTIFSPWETFLTHQLLFLSQKQFAECIATTGLRG